MGRDKSIEGHTNDSKAGHQASGSGEMSHMLQSEIFSGVGKVEWEKLTGCGLLFQIHRDSEIATTTLMDRSMDRSMEYKFAHKTSSPRYPQASFVSCELVRTDTSY